MDLSIPPIVRGEFIYRDVLLVDAGGDGKRHPCAAESEIKAILSGKAKDMVGHWWEAQLIHYGLNRSKVKDTCKVRLQQAIGQGKLKQQPPHLSDMEGQMKREFAAAVRKAKNQTKSQGSTVQGKKRAREDDNPSSSSKKTKISVKVNGVEIEIDQSSSNNQPTTKTARPNKSDKLAATKADVGKKPSAAKTSKESTPAKAAPAKSAKKNTSTPKATLASQKTQAVGSGTAETTSSASYAHHPDNVFQTPKSQTAKATIKREPKVKSEPGTSASRPSAVKKEPKIKTEPGINRASPIKHEGYLFDPDAMDTRADMSERQVSVTGVYNLSCEQITDQLPRAIDTLRLFICVDHETGTTWGAFELAMKSGVIKIDDIGVERKLSFGWRSRDSETGRLQFGKGCFGDIAFYGDEQVRGCFYNLFPMFGMSGVSAPAEFVGERRPGPLWCGRSAPSFREEWDGFVNEAYGR
ncbi:uncharacterized protein RCC_09625 [Ramularia collo-cygni]|uniref:Uncharacterized protein n=1 Tax=Ramularia collo-cygni TaxID=112498 RepID=A0A2D3VAD9_9PEZI|nr:uncharacterized protein RCC_09625 [Ramularia collo-cygni]CZT23910.1 uncharacterized protein RCC_09625 [Ramularia collo-cygni]